MDSSKHLHSSLPGTNHPAYSILCEVASSGDKCSNSSERSVLVHDRSSDQSEYIEMDLAIPRGSTNSMARRQSQNTSPDSQEFEFNMSTIVTDVLEPIQVAPADELFFRGQLLPLQHDNRLQLVQTLSNQEDDESLAFSTIGEDAMSKYLPCSFDEDEVCLDPGLLDSRSSSFRSQHSSYWESAEKESRDSSSSRCSHGSSQDSGCLPGGKKLMSGDHAEATVVIGGQCPKPEKSCKSQAKCKKWSWKSLFKGLRRASSSRISQDQRSSSSEINGRKRNSNFRNDDVRYATGQSRSSIISKSDHQSWSSNHGFKNEGKGKNQASMMAGDHQVSSNYCTSCTNRSSSRYKQSSRQARGRYWQRYLNKVKPLYDKISSYQRRHGDHHRERSSPRSYNAAAAHAATNFRSSNCTPLAKSPARGDDYMTCDLSSSRYLSVASCPASMRSSPHHSGVLAIVNTGSGHMSSMNDLHGAIQAAIAHCKQSQSGKQWPAV